MAHSNAITLEMLDAWVETLKSDHDRCMNEPDLIIMSKAEWDRYVAGKHPFYKNPSEPIL